MVKVWWIFIRSVMISLFCIVVIIVYSRVMFIGVFGIVIIIVVVIRIFRYIRVCRCVWNRIFLVWYIFKVVICIFV